MAPIDGHKPKKAKFLYILSTPPPPPKGTIQDGWCVDRKHFVIQFLFLSYVLTIHIHLYSHQVPYPITLSTHYSLAFPFLHFYGT